MIRRTGKIIGIVVLCLFVIGLIASSQEARPEPRVVVKTKIVTKTEYVKTPVLSDACRQALQEAGDMAEYATKIADVGNEELDILSDARLAVFEKDAQDLVRASDRQTRLSESITPSFSKLLEVKLDHDITVEACEDSLDEQ